MAPAGGLGGLQPPSLLGPLRHLNVYASSALHTIWDLVLLFLGGNTIGNVCIDFWTPLTVSTLTALAPQHFFLASSLTLHAVSRHGTPSLTSLLKDGGVSCFGRSSGRSPIQFLTVHSHAQLQSANGTGWAVWLFTPRWC